MKILKPGKWFPDPASYAPSRLFCLDVLRGLDMFYLAVLAPFLNWSLFRFHLPECTAPEWLRLTFHNFDVVGTFCTEDHYIFLNADGTKLAVLEIHALGNVCKPEGQEHYDNMRSLLNKAMNISD